MKIMKKNILFGVVCVALLTATSCSDFLDVQPEGDARDNAYFLNDQQAIDAVDGLYERFHQEAMYGRELFWEQGAANDIVWEKHVISRHLRRLNIQVMSLHYVLCSKPCIK